MHSVALPLFLDEESLLAKAREIAGQRLCDLLHREHKGGVGEAVERALGLSPSGRAEPDVASLGIEVKSLPVDDGRVVESTWVCSANPRSLIDETWLSSKVRAKLARVLFVPVEAGSGSLEERRVGTPFLWSPALDDESTLRDDWEDLADLVARGVGFAVTARRGRALQLRPKARDASVRRTTVNVDGDSFSCAPQGFYLRRAFTQRIVDEVFGAR